MSESYFDRLKEIMSKYPPGEFEKLLEEAHPDVKEAFQILMTIAVKLMEQLRMSYEERTELIKMVEEIREEIEKGLEKLKFELDLRAIKRMSDILTSQRHHIR